MARATLGSLEQYYYKKRRTIVIPQLLNGFWCDGISDIPFNITECSINNIRKHQRIITKAYSGKSGQDIYELTILLGNKSLDNYINGFSLIDDLPDSEIDDWIDFDFLNRKILIRLL